MENRNNIITYDAIDLMEQIIDDTSWNHVYNYLNRDNTSDSEATILKIYIWNTGNKNILIDDFNVKLISEQPHMD